MKNIIFFTIIGVLIIASVYFSIQYLDRDENKASDLNPMVESKEPEESQEAGLKIEILEPGTGAKAQNGNRLTVHYAGYLEDGTKFDSSIDRGEPFSFVLGQGLVIQGWELGLQDSQAGEKRKLIIPSELGYGETGTPGGPIPPNATLVFEIEVLSIDN